MQLPGWTNAWTMPIKTRDRHASTGHPHADRHQDLRRRASTRIERIGIDLERIVSRVPNTRSVYSDRSTGGFYLDIVPNREALARYGLTLGEVQDVIEAAVGGQPIEVTRRGPQPLQHQRALPARAAAGHRAPAPRPGAAARRWRAAPASGGATGARAERPVPLAALESRRRRRLSRAVDGHRH